jgi:hypothetical protein
VEPTTDQVIASMRHSLATHVLPHVDDAWGRYVTKVMDRMLVHLADRIRLEGSLLVEDTRDLVDVLAATGADADADDVPDWVDPEALATRNAALRAQLDQLLAAGPPSVVHAHLTAYLHRQVARDSRLTEATFMSFGPAA